MIQARFSPIVIWTHLQGTYWFLPSVVTLAAIFLAVAFTQLDRHAWGADALPGWFYGGGADGARALLSAVAGSIITVVAVTFSVTIVALTVASQHFGPRLLNSFMRDRPAQLVLGTFIGTFAYCLVVLRSVQGEGDGYSVFVPHLAVTAALALTLVSVAALIYYVHHVAVSLQVSEIARAVTSNLEEAIDRLYPEHFGADAGPDQPLPKPPADAVDVPFNSSGYVQRLEGGRVLEAAVKADVVVWLRVRPGDFATEGLPVAVAAPPPRDPDAFARQLNGAIVLGADRTDQQDAGFPLQQLVEVSLHALSTGINEPFTAVTCIDRIGQGLARLATRRIPSPLRADDGGHVRVIAPLDSFRDLLDKSFDPIRAHATGSPVVGGHLLKVLSRIATVAQRAEDRAAIRRQADLVLVSMAEWRQDPSVKEQMENARAKVERAAPA